MNELGNVGQIYMVVLLALLVIGFGMASWSFMNYLSRKVTTGKKEDLIASHIKKDSLNNNKNNGGIFMNNNGWLKLAVYSLVGVIVSVILLGFISTSNPQNGQYQGSQHGNSGYMPAGMPMNSGMGYGNQMPMNQGGMQNNPMIQQELNRIQMQLNQIQQQIGGMQGGQGMSNMPQGGGMGMMNGMGGMGGMSNMQGGSSMPQGGGGSSMPQGGSGSSMPSMPQSGGSSGGMGGMGMM